MRTNYAQMQGAELCKHMAERFTEQVFLEHMLKAMGRLQREQGDMSEARIQYDIGFLSYGLTELMKGARRGKAAQE